jgi:hypothetical protein
LMPSSCACSACTRRSESSMAADIR